GVGDTDLLGDRPERRTLRAFVGEDLDRPVEDLLPAGHAFRVRARSARGGGFVGHVRRLAKKNLRVVVFPGSVSATARTRLAEGRTRMTTPAISIQLWTVRDQL